MAVWWGGADASKCRKCGGDASGLAGRGVKHHPKTVIGPPRSARVLALLGVLLRSALAARPASANIDSMSFRRCAWAVTLLGPRPGVGRLCAVGPPGPVEIAGATRE